MTSGHHERLVRTASRAHIPLAVLFEVTYRCNLGCRHCYLTEGPVGRPRPRRDELTLDEVRAALEQLAEAGTLFLSLTGGEVFLRRDFLDIVAHARRLAFSVTVFTTGTLLTGETAAALAKLDPLSVEVSIYSARPEIHDRVTGIPGSHARSLQALRWLRERGVIILIKSPVMSLNAGEYHGIVELAESLGAGFGFDPMLVPRRDGDRTPVQLSASQDELRRFLGDPVVARVFHEPVRCLPSPGEELCGTGRRTCMISPYGDVFACAVHPSPAGNLREKRFRDIWNGSPVLQDVRAASVGDLRNGARPLDHGFRCSALALIEDGDFLGPHRRGEALADLHREALGDG